MTTTNYLKHTSDNVAQRFLLKRFESHISRILAGIRPNSLLDAGCGEGFVLNLLKQKKIGKKHMGIDISTTALKLQKKIHPNLTCKIGNIYNIPFRDNSFDAVICNEVLEHVEHPLRAINELRRVTKKYMLFSVPHEPYFMTANFLRGKYLKAWGNHPEHINHWTATSFKKLISGHSTLLEHKLIFPWQVVLCQI